MLLMQAGNKKGISIIEILVAVAILGVTFSSLFGLIGFSLRASNMVKQSTQANVLAQGVMEAVRDFRNQNPWEVSGLGVLSVGTAYHPEKTGGVLPEWNLVLGQVTAGIFTKQVIFETVYRDSNDDIKESGIEDPYTKKATVTVFWQERGRDHQMELVSYFTNWQK